MEHNNIVFYGMFAFRFRLEKFWEEVEKSSRNQELTDPITLPQRDNPNSKD